MAEFRFRAAAALDLRRTEEGVALKGLAYEQARFHEAETTVDAGRTRLQQAQADLAALARRGSDASTLLWHRNWIVRLAGDLHQLQTDLDQRATDLEKARQAWQVARRRRLALERLKDRAWRRFQQLELRQEMKALDELARVRHVMTDHWRHDT